MCKKHLKCANNIISLKIKPFSTDFRRLKCYIIFQLHSLSTSTSQGKQQQRGPRLEHDFVHSSDSSLEDEETQRRKKVPGSRPTSGSSSRPHSGSTTSRPQSGATSRPTSGSTSRPTSGTTSRPQSGSSRHHNVPRPTSAKSQGISSVKNSASNTGSPKCSKNVPKPSRKDKIDLSANHTPKSADSPELHVSSQLPTHRSDLMNGNVTNRSVSRMSRKSVKEIPKDDVRLSVIKSSEVKSDPCLSTMSAYFVKFMFFKCIYILYIWSFKKGCFHRSPL